MSLNHFCAIIQLFHCIFQCYTCFSDLVQWALLHYNPFKYFPRASTKIMGYQQQLAIQLYAKTQWCSLDNLSASTYYSFWTRLVFSTATPSFLAQVTLCFLMLVVNPAKPLSPGACTLWNIFGPCNDAIYSLSRSVVLKNMHQQVSPFCKPTSPPSLTSIKTLIWRI